MSVMPSLEPQCEKEAQSSVELEIVARRRELDAHFSVRRLLPSAARRMVGPFIFVDHFGPVHMDPGLGLDVRPHPHINLATVTFLFEGEILHRDSLGSEQAILPDAINWMNAGRGIVHSERSPALERKSGPRLHGMQLWVALPAAHEEDPPTFAHHAKETLPIVEQPGARLRILAGAAYGATSPVAVCSPLFYVEARLERGARLRLPDEYHGRGAYVVEGAIKAGDKPHQEGVMAIFRPKVPAEIEALSESRVLLLGGAPLGERHIYWNFVSSSQERIERAKEDWSAGRFPKVPGDETEFIPLPDAR